MTTIQNVDFPAKYWHELPDGRIQCDICPRACKLNEGQNGMCFVRARHNDQLVLLTYGRSSGFCIDPIEKKPLDHFLPGTPVFSFGTAGCNLACKFCQNWDISESRRIDILAAKAMPEKIAQAAYEYGCKSVAFTYNEPTIFFEYAIDVAKECHKFGLKTVAVTNGYICKKPREEFYQHMDAANVDLKAFTDRFYSKITSGKLDPILDTLKYLKHETNVWFEITTLLIPGENDSDEEIEKLSTWIIKNLGPFVPLHFTAFHPAYKMLDKPATSLVTLIRARNIAIKNGLYYVYTGNIYGPKTSSTYCHNCGKLLIGRDYYNISAYNLTHNGHCKFCDTKCAGVFLGPAGTWGDRRQPVSLDF